MAVVIQVPQAQEGKHRLFTAEEEMSDTFHDSTFDGGGHPDGQSLLRDGVGPTLPLSSMLRASVLCPSK